MGNLPRAALREEGPPVLYSMIYCLYNLAASLAAPIGAAYLAVHHKHRPLLGRFSPPLSKFSSDRPAWFQACSVGEVGVARSFIAAFRERWPNIPLLLTCSTVAGHDLAEGACDDIPVGWFPLDHPWIVRRFFSAVSPRVLVLIETEVWPNVVRHAHRRRIPVVIVNGRLSDRHYPRYRRFRGLMRPIFARVTAAGMQNAEYAERLAALGLDRSHIHITGNAKFGDTRTKLAPHVAARLRDEHGFDAETPVLIFGSTRPGDEALAAHCWQALREEFPALRLVVAPRHLDRLNEAIAPFSSEEPLCLRSEVQDGPRPAGRRVVVLDTLGELVAFYAIASVAVIGGSFYPGVDGHNPIESAALGVPTVFGPYMRNFIDAAGMLVKSGGACQVACPEDLLDTLRRLLADSGARAHMAVQARETVSANQGAIQRNLDLLEPLLV